MLELRDGQYLFQESKIIEEIEKYRIISFDVFDTLIKRDCANPSDLFGMMQDYSKGTKYESASFAQKRVYAEALARKESERCEVTFLEIYKKLGEFYSKEACEYYKNLEICFEKSLCHANKHIKNIYNYCVKNKTIIISSDMYLDKEVIEDILRDNGFAGYKKLYLSSELMVTKSNGSLYDYILDELGARNNDILHIGDNKYSDYKQAKRKDIPSVIIPKVMNSNLIYSSKSFANEDDSKQYNCLGAFIDNHYLYESEYFYQLGYETEGPLLCGFVKWLHSRILKNDINKIFFLARDGKIMRDAYSKLITEPVDNVYMYGSRRSLIVPMLWKCNSLEEVVSSIAFAAKITVENIIKRCGLNPHDYERVIRKYGFEPHELQIFADLLEEEKFNDLFTEIFPDIRSNSKKEFDLLVRYLKQIGFNGNVAVVDIGWFGNMQKSLQSICKEAGIDVKIYGYYVGLNAETDTKNKGINAEGYLFQYNKNLQLFNKERFFNAIFEVMFSTFHGSVIKFEENAGVVQPVLGRVEYGNNEFKIIKLFQEGALKFVEDVSKEPEFTIDWNPCVSFHNYTLMCLAPNARIAKNIGNMKMMDDEILYIAKPKEFKYYIIHPIKMMKDYKKSLWSIGFLKRVFRGKLPYYEFLCVVQKVKMMVKKR